MLPPFIIDQIRRREDDARRDAERPRLELPIDSHRPERPEQQDEDERTERGVIILDLI